MSTYDLGSAFKTPSKSKPAKVIRNTQRQIVVSEKDKLEESLIDEEFGLIDQEEERSLFSAEIVPSSRTPVYSPRKSKRDFEREGHETTVTELTKLITHLSHNQSSRFERIIMSRYTAILILIVTVLFFAPNLRPYCGQGINFLPCVPCPAHAICNSYSIAGCISQDDHVYTPHNGLCIRNSTLGLVSYNLTLHAKDLFEQKAWLHDCVGRVPSKMIETDELLTQLFDEVYESAGDQAMDVSFTHAIKEMKDIFNDNTAYFKVAKNDEGLFYSYRFDGPLSCIGPNGLKQMVTSIISGDLFTVRTHKPVLVAPEPVVVPTPAPVPEVVQEEEHKEEQSEIITLTEIEEVITPSEEETTQNDIEVVLAGDNTPSA